MGLWSKDWTLLCNWNFKTLHKFGLGKKVYILMQLARIHICKLYFYIINNILWWHRYIHYTWAFIWPHTQTLLALLVYVIRKIICFPCWNFPNHGTPCHALGTIRKLSMSRGAPKWFGSVRRCMVHNSYWILNNFVKENSTKSKPNILGKFAKAVSSVGNPSLSEWDFLEVIS